MDRRTVRNKKSKTRNARPYDRPNQSILGRVASKVKGILNPSWIFNVSQWMGSQEEDPGSDPQDEESAEEDTAQSPPHGSKRPRLANYDQPPSIQSEGTQTWLDTPSSSLFNPASRLTSTVTQNSLMENKAEQVIINGDDHSENSEGSASTSGCSSLVSSHKERSNCIPVPNRRLVQSPFDLRSELNRRDVTSRKDESADMSASRMSLWSGSNVFSPAAKLQRRSPAVGHSNTPGFNIGAFVGPSKTSQQSERKVASPFYQGKTSFGGASSTRRMPASVAPYQVERPARNQIKVRARESEDSLEGMSSAAKRILMTLEKMSSPVTDAKKIPNTNRSPVDLSLYLMPPKFRSNVVSSPTITKGPPIANISTITRLTTLKNCSSNRRLQNTSMDSSILTETRNRPSSETSQQTFTKIIESITPKEGGGKMRSKLTQKHQPSVKNTEENLDNFSLPDVHLPIKVLPNFNFDLQPSKSVIETKNPRLEFEFSPPVDVLQQSPLPSHSKSDKQISIASFTFSSPTTKIGPGGVFNMTPSIAQKSSSETSVKNTKTSEASGNTSSSISKTTTTPSLQVPFGVSNTSKPAPKWKCDECWIQNPDKEMKCLSCETPRKKATPLSTVENATKSSSKWTCSECWISNPSNESKCLACETPKKASPTPSEFNTLAKSECWRCKECWVENPAKNDKCLACETPKNGKTATPAAPMLAASSGFGGKSAGSWSCSECWVQNSSEKAKCIACEAPNPSGTKSSGVFRISPESKDSEADTKSENKTSENSGFFKLIEKEAKKPVDPLLATPNGALKMSSGFPVSDWECDTCLVRNASDKLKCSACETLRPSKRNNSGFKDPETFKFNSPLQNSPIAFKFGSYSIPAQTTSTSATFSFGDTNKGASSFFATASNLTTTTTKSSEEPLSTETSTSKPVPGFKFGSSNMPTIEVTKPDIPVVDLVDNDDSREKPSTVFGSALSKTTQSNTLTSTAFKIATPLSNSNDTVSSSFFTQPSSTVSNTIKSQEAPKSTFTESTVPLFKFGSTNKPAAEVTKPDIPVVDLVDNDNGVKPSDVFGNAVSKTGNSFKIASPAVNAISQMPVSTESKLPSLFSAKADPPAVTPQTTLNSTPVTSQTGQTKETPTGGFNFKVPTLGSSALGGFSTPTSASSKNLSSTERTLLKPLDASGDKRLTSLFNQAVSSSSNSSPFNTTTSNNSMFKMSDKVDSVKATESSWGRGVTAATTAAPVFNFGAAPTTTATQSFSTNVSKSVDTKPVASLAPFSAAAPTTGSFSFGNAAVSTSQSTASSGGFSFFAGSTAPAPSLFTFGATSNAAEPAKTGGFPATSTPSVFGAAAPTTTSTFVFGAVKSEPVNSTPATNFAFGSAPSTQAAPSTFGGFQTNQPATTPAPFQFGSQPANNASSTAGFGAASSGFTFGAKIETPNQMAPATSQATGFGIPSMQQQQPMFGAASSAFGKTEKPAGFNFGAAASASSPFQFGSPMPTASQQGVSQPAASQPVASQQAAPQFNFGTPQQDQNAGQFQPQFNTPPTFNFGAASNSAGPFQFAAAPPDNQPPPGQRRIRKAIRRRRD